MCWRLYTRPTSSALKVFKPLHMLWMGIWVHPYTLTAVQVGPNFGNMGVWVSPNPNNGTCMEDVNHLIFLLTANPNSYEVIEPLHMLWMGIMWVRPCTFTAVQVGPNFGKLGLRVSPNIIMVSCLEAVNHPIMYLTYILDVLQVSEHIHMLWMGMWVHPYTLTPVQKLYRWG